MKVRNLDLGKRVDIMLGIILAGGTGTRLLPLTELVNKHLLPVYNQNMIMYPLNTLINAGIKDIMIVSGREHAGQFLQILGSGRDFGVNLSYTVQENSGGIAEALGMCKRFTNGNKIAVVLGDNIFEDKFDFSNFREDARVYIKRVEDPQRYGVARIKKSKLEDNKIVEIVEKPDITKVDNELIDKGGWGYAVTGLYLYDSRVFNIIQCLKPSKRDELEITDVNNQYIKEDRMDFEIVDGFWSDAGTHESLYNAATFVRNKEIEKSAMK